MREVTANVHTCYCPRIRQKKQNDALVRKTALLNLCLVIVHLTWKCSPNWVSFVHANSMVYGHNSSMCPTLAPLNDFLSQIVCPRISSPLTVCCRVSIFSAYPNLLDWRSRSNMPSAWYIRPSTVRSSLFAHGFSLGYPETNVGGVEMIGHSHALFLNYPLTTGRALAGTVSVLLRHMTSPNFFYLLHKTHLQQATDKKARPLILIYGDEARVRSTN